MTLAAEITLMADTALELRRDNAALKQALRAKQDTIEAQQRRIERLEKALKLVRAKAAQFALEMERMDREV